MITVQHRAMDDRIHLKQARSLRDHGHRLTMIHASPDEYLRDMSGNILNVDGAERFKYDGMRFIRVKEPDGLLARWAKKMYCGPFYKKLVAAAVSSDSDLFVAHEPQSIIVAKKAAEATHSRWLFDAHESLYFKSLKDRYAKWKWMSQLPAFTAANGLTAFQLQKSNPTAPSLVVHNASLFLTAQEFERTETVVIHEGHFPWNRGLILLMTALSILKKSRPEFKMIIVGSMKDEEADYFDKMIQENDLAENVSTTGWLDYMDVPTHLNEASIGLILNEPTPNNLYGGPANKLFNYINAGLCVVSVDLPETKRIVEEIQCGVILKSREAEALALTLELLHTDKDLLRNYRQAAMTVAPSIHWNIESKKLITFYDTILD